MNLLTREELKVLSEQRGDSCISIFMPTRRSGDDATQGRIRLKNLLRVAREQLIAGGVRSRNAGQMLNPIRRLIGITPFWQYQGDGLAVFLADGFLRCYKVPMAFVELVVVAQRFHLKPLLPLLFDDGQYYVLALSQKKVRFFECTRYSAKEVALEGVPQNLEEAVRLDEPRKQLQVHTGAGAAIFHGHGGGIDNAKTQLTQYFRQIDHGLNQLLKSDAAPLVLAGVDYLFPIYREVNTYTSLCIDEGISGNPDEQKAAELKAKAWDLVAPQFKKQHDDCLARYRQLAGSGLTSNDVRVVAEASFRGRVDLLFVGVGIQRWGRFNEENGRMDLHDEFQPGDEDLLDWAAIQTLRNGGKVFAVTPSEVPEGTSLAAVFRF